MKYLIDTHTFLWIIEDNKNLTDKVRTIYIDNSNEIYLSVASIWEMAI
jgi:PIN domain nuclease of toxin-antitoxin system